MQTIAGDGFAETSLEPGALVWFTPGTIHRLVNTTGDLEILVLMANAGLPEAGDMVITFPTEVVRDPDAYRAAATLPAADLTTAGSPDPARTRRDRAVEGFLALRRALEAGDRAPLEDLHVAAAELVAPAVSTWRARWVDGPLAEVERTRAHLEALDRGSAAHLGDSSVHRIAPPPDERRMGCCGTLGTYVRS